jgi:hypothetical protein
MAAASTSIPLDRGDLLRAVAFCQAWFDDWLKRGMFRPEQHQAITDYYTDWHARIAAGSPIPPNAHLVPAGVCWSCKEIVEPGAQDCESCGALSATNDATTLRYLMFLSFEICKQQEAGRVDLAAADGCLADTNAHITTLRARLDAERVPMATAHSQGQHRAAQLAETLQQSTSAIRTPDTVRSELPSRPLRSPEGPPARRNVMEILLDVRTIQWLLASGGALLALGLLIWLAAEGLFQNPVFVASLLGGGTAALLVAGWAVCHFTRYQLVGRALTLLACLVMPFNLWFYDAQGLVTLSEGHLWIPALVCCALYGASARVLRDTTFVYVLVFGVAGTGLLILADHLVERFWEIGAPATFLVTLGLVAIHAERAFPNGEGAFSRERFGLAFFWAGHAVLGAGMLLLLGAHVSGDWLFGLFQPIYDAHGAGRPEIVASFAGRLQSLALVLAATYAYAYSDLVVRRVGVYIHLAVFCLLWAEVLLIRLIPLPLPQIEVVILFLALTGLAANLALTRPAVRETALVRAGPSLALFLSILPVLLGVILHYRATALVPLEWRYNLSISYVLTMLVTAAACRVGAFLYRQERPSLSLTYFFGTGAATMAGAAGLLLVLFPERSRWEFQAPILMLIPLAYLVAARLYRGHTPQRPLVWVAQAATAVMLVSSIATTFRGFLFISGESLNLTLALFFAEAALFYGLEACWSKHPLSVYACTAAACAAVWQLLKFGQVADEFYILTFALVGLGLLVAYRFAVLERTPLAGLAGAAFQSANVLLSLAFVAGGLRTLSELMQDTAKRGVLLSLSSLLVVIALVAVTLVRHEGWRRWYVAMAISQAVLFVLVLAVLSHLTHAQRLEIVCVISGLLLLAVGHVGWYREQDRHNDLVSTSLFFGSVLVALPLAVAVVSCRIQKEFDTFHTVNEIAMLAAGMLLLATGYACQIKSTTLAGGFLTVVYLVTLLLYIRIPDKLQTTAVYLMVGGGLFSAVGTFLTIYRDRLLQLPDRIKRREGIFRVLTWR